MASRSQIPKDTHTWQEMMMKTYSSTNQPIDSIRLPSASKMGLNGFLLLRTIWPPRQDAANLNKLVEKSDNHLVSKNHFVEAKDFLDHFKSWNHYLLMIENNKSLKAGQSHALTKGAIRGTKMPPDASKVEGTFSLVFYYQKRSNGLSPDSDGDDYSSKVVVADRPMTRSRTAALQTPTKQKAPALIDDEELLDDMDNLSFGETPQSTTSHKIGALSPLSPVSGDAAKLLRAIEDEQIVNTALLLFLQGLTVHHPGVKGEWSLYRQSFELQDSNGDRVYEARVDGLFRPHGSSSATMIIEVKPSPRRIVEGVYDKVRMQESAQMAAWIGCNPPAPTYDGKISKHRRLIVSQDRHEVYLTVGTFDDNYVNFIRGSGRNDSFLEMQEYGPFDISEKAHMFYLGRIMLGLSLQSGV